jgi:hypothetical protein
VRGNNLLPRLETVSMQTNIEKRNEQTFPVEAHNKTANRCGSWPPQLMQSLWTLLWKRAILLLRWISYAFHRNNIKGKIDEQAMGV